LAATNHDFLWSPTTGVSDPIKVTEALAREFVSLGGSIKLGSEITFRSGLRANGESISADHFINAAGAYSIDLAHAMGFGSEYRVMPFLGTYKQVDQKTLPIRTLIYPVPHPVNPFLGVHFTLTIDNKVKIGPTAIPILGKEQYRLTDGFTLRDIKDFLRNTTAIVRGEKHNLGSIAISEFPNLVEKTLLQRAAKLVPSAHAVSEWGKKRPGIRSQLLNVSKGELVQDFVVEGDGRSTHVLNAVSPGWTAAMPFGEYVAKIALKLS
jgi:L-2-hydroxyglutarate oxidase LhgO